MTFVTDFSISRNFKTQFINFSVCENEKNLTSTKDDDKFQNKNFFHHDDDNSIDEKFFVDDDDDIDVKLKLMTKKKSNFFSEKRILRIKSCEY